MDKHIKKKQLKVEIKEDIHITDKLIVLLNIINRYRFNTMTYTFQTMERLRRLIKIFMQENKISDLAEGIKQYRKTIEKKIANKEKV